jgi:hypothetical protein
MNLNGASSRGLPTLLLDNFRFWSTAYRPLGGVFYSTIYHVVGFHSLPFRIACFVLLGLNLYLLYRFCCRLNPAPGPWPLAPVFAIFLAAYHAWFVDLYYSTGTVYDLLCYAFYFAAFIAYLEGRRLWLVLVLYICALNAKEMAVTLPFFILLYELLWHGRKAALTAALSTGAITAIYIAGKLHGPDSLERIPSYQLTISPGRFLDVFHLYLNPFFYQNHFFRDSNTVQLLLVMLAVALLLRSRPMIFAWCFILVSTLPIAFIQHYSAFFWYLPMAGWALYAGTVLQQIAERLRAPQWAVLLVLALALAPFHIRESRKTRQTFFAFQPPVRETTAQLKALAPTLPHSARVLFVDDPFPRDGYYLYFLTRLLYRDLTIQVERTAVHPVPPSDYPGYDRVFVFRNGRIEGG